ncbi:DNA-3-methyladenine glycosylase [[Candida] jaroonii]|uniref:DNA-3-methyladenine glycosylase n=1 Tax=[Candida] jaroonii TaxID=467808 RepID=A0ACA9Y5E6_9ASCO|nr:DNA-3-methyladenine glycosylase [[Candida] jaroonii]
MKDITKITKPAIAKSPRKAKPKLLYEDNLQHVQISKSLPKAFIEFHKPHFIKGVNHILKVDPSLYPVIVNENFKHFENDEDNSIKSQVVVDETETIRKYWLSLISSIISQQISGSAAKSIYGRFEALFKESPNPKELLEMSTEDLRAVGLSSMKVKYVIDISENFGNPENPLTSIKFYQESSLDEIVTELVKLKGVGEWSAKMFALFTLKEWDVFAETDLGVARGASNYLSKRPELLKDIKQGISQHEDLVSMMKKKGKFSNGGSKRDWIAYHEAYYLYLSLKFAPYRSILTLLFWRLSATNVEVLEND